ncbi:DUF411 domain-containing protein [Moraxella nasovis]|uniref:DUF411 domain-containing protein n=1 Tax=Moraxella nasovis TaxID=2904121 RepID=UPI001F61234D|nr:DUF411 domain-containing protein [Moraxella nasovis]UNU73836.1 DUF411 domain-containing protein [Moraxella nasovis]
MRSMKKALATGVLSVSIIAGAVSLFVMNRPAQAVNHVEVWKDANCGCCGEWVEHMKKNGFTVSVHNTGNREMRAKLGMPEKFASCHTAKVGGYVIEGHTPASDIKRLLTQKPNALGLATPAMPLGSPGMDGEAYQGKKHDYNVLLVQKDGTSQVYQAYKGNQN